MNIDDLIRTRVEQLADAAEALQEAEAGRVDNIEPDIAGELAASIRVQVVKIDHVLTKLDEQAGRGGFV